MMLVVDIRMHAHPVLTIRHDAVWLDVNGKNYVFSIKAWNFFTEHLEELISLDSRASKCYPDTLFGSDVKLHISNQNGSVRMSIYPGSYIDEWFVEFYELQKDKAGLTDPVIFKTHLRTASGQGSIYRKDELKALFQPIKSVC